MTTKQLSWEKFNTQEEDDDDEGVGGGVDMPGMILSQVNDLGPNVNSYEDFNFFIAHTNFYITLDVVVFISLVKGVESLDVLSPYRFRISIGKLFEVDPVLSLITEELTRE